MCQAYESEARVVRMMEAYDRRMRHVLDGTMARQDGRPRSDWECLTYGVDHEAPDEPHRHRTPSWWKAHHWHGPSISAWLSGWDEEDARVAAGGGPMSVEEREEAEADLRFLGNLDYELRHAGLRHVMAAHDLSRLARLRGADDHGDFVHGRYDVVTKAALTWTKAAKDLIEARLVPHVVAMRAVSEEAAVA